MLTLAVSFAITYIVFGGGGSIITTGALGLQFDRAVFSIWRGRQLTLGGRARIELTRTLAIAIADIIFGGGLTIIAACSLECIRHLT